MSAPALRTHRREDGRVLELVIDAPKGHVLTRALMAGLDESIAAAARDPALKLVVVTGAGKHFSFGAAVDEHRPAHVGEMLATFHRLVRTVARSPVPVAAAVDGRCLGGAFELVLACHFVMATPRARFACPELKLGVFAPVLAALGPLKLGPALTEELLLTGRDLDAAEARAAGLVTALAPDGSEPAAFAVEWYRANLAPLSAASLRQAVKATRTQPIWTRALGEGIDFAERLYLDAIVPSHDGNEGIEAFLARRPPQWRDA